MANFGNSEDSLTTDDEILKYLEEKVDNLYNFRDNYFENHRVEEAARRQNDIQEQLHSVLEILRKYEVSAIRHNRAKYYYLKGRSLNILSNYSKECEELLSKAVKLDPQMIDAWNELGETYWKNDNINEAENCFNGALNQKRNKISLRNLSMICRIKKYTSAEEYKGFIELGVSLAKEAVELDPSDGASWLVLGNAHLSSFFGIVQSPKVLKHCLSAYSQAEKKTVARHNPDLHYNKAVTLQYEEEFKLALESFNTASLYDPSWENPKLKANQLIKYLEDITKFVKTSGGMKSKRLQRTIESIDSKQLGPFEGGTFTSKAGQTAKLVLSSLNDLCPGTNKEKVILGKVVCSVYKEDKVPFAFCMVDKEGTCVAVSVFNIAQNKGFIIGDSIAIPEPYVTDNNFKYQEKEFKFRLIRVDTPLVMIVNGKKLGRDIVAVVQMEISKNLT